MFLLYKRFLYWPHTHMGSKRSSRHPRAQMTKMLASPSFNVTWRRKVAVEKFIQNQKSDDSKVGSNIEVEDGTVQGFDRQNRWSIFDWHKFALEKVSVIGQLFLRKNLLRDDKIAYQMNAFSTHVTGVHFLWTPCRGRRKLTHRRSSVNSMHKSWYVSVY